MRYFVGRQTEARRERHGFQEARIHYGEEREDHRRIKIASGNHLSRPFWGFPFDAQPGSDFLDLKLEVIERSGLQFQRIGIAIDIAVSRQLPRLSAKFQRHCRPRLRLNHEIVEPGLRYLYFPTPDAGDGSAWRRIRGQWIAAPA